MPSTRQRKVRELLVQEVSEILRREVRDPRIGFVTITDAEVSPDLRHATVFYSVLGDDAQRAETGRALERAAGFVRSEFSRRAQMRYVPDIRFRYDTAVDRGARIGELLEQVRREEEERTHEQRTPGGTEDGGGGDPTIE